MKKYIGMMALLLVVVNGANACACRDGDRCAKRGILKDCIWCNHQVKQDGQLIDESYRPRC